MRKLTCSMGASLDGYIVGPDGGFDWAVPDEEVFAAHIEEIRDVGVHLMGRRLYETMLGWETAEQDPSLDDAEQPNLPVESSASGTPSRADGGGGGRSSRPGTGGGRAATSAPPGGLRPHTSGHARSAPGARAT